MNLSLVLLLFAFLPFCSAALLALAPSPRVGARLNLGGCLLLLGATIALLQQDPHAGIWLHIDELNGMFLLLNAVVGSTAAWFGIGYVRREIDAGRMGPRAARFYHALYQAMLGAMNLALLADNIGLMWVGLEVATLVTVVMVGLYRTAAALEAAWKYFILGSVGISLALFGTILVYAAGQQVLGEGLPAMSWHGLRAAAASLDAPLLNLAFAFLLVGYGTKAGLVPLHAWLPDAHAEGPTPVAAVLSGLLLNVALHALLRFKSVLDAHPGGFATGPLLIALGLASMALAAFMLMRRGDIKRLFAWSSIEHMGLATLAFGIGGPAILFAALLHLNLHSLVKSAIFYTVGNIVQRTGTQRVSELHGLSVTHPALSLGLGAGVIAIAGLPPFGLFASEFLMLGAAYQSSPWLALAAAALLLVALGALVSKLQGLLLGGPPSGGLEREPAPAASTALWPAGLHLGLVLGAGLALPTVCSDWLRRAVAVLN